jgi:tRNA modification GTPase
VCLVVLDGSAPLTAADQALIGAVPGAMIIAVNKADRPAAWSLDVLGERAGGAVRVSAHAGTGLDPLRAALAGVLVGDRRLLDDLRVTNVRHARLLEDARSSLGRAEGLAGAAGHEEVLLAEVHAALRALQEITGRRAPDAVIREIFALFCIGK